VILYFLWEISAAGHDSLHSFELVKHSRYAIAFTTRDVSLMLCQCKDKRYA